MDTRFSAACQSIHACRPHRGGISDTRACVCAVSAAGQLRAFVATGLLLLAGTANAQLCTGAQSLARQPIQLRAVASFDTVVRAMSGGVRIGGRGAFGDVQLGSSHIKEYDASSFVVGAIIAYQVALGSKGRIQFCPAASLGFDIGPKNIQGSGADYNGNDWGLGGVVGVLATHSAEIELVPTLSFTFVHANQKLTDNTTFTTSTSRTIEVIELGVGLVHRQQLSFKPIISVALPGSVTGFGLSLSYSLGHSE